MYHIQRGRPTTEVYGPRYRAPVQPGVNYAYDLTVEVVRDGKALMETKNVPVRAGETTNVGRPAPQVQRPTVNLNNEYQMRQQGQLRVQNFRQARPQIQPTPQFNRAPAGFSQGMRGGGGRGGRR